MNRLNSQVQVWKERLSSSGLGFLSATGSKFSSDVDLLSTFGPVSASLDAKFTFRKDFLTTMSYFSWGI